MEVPYSSNEAVEAVVRRVLKIEDVTVGGGKQNYIVRYRGRLYSEDTAAAYDTLSEQLKPYGLTPLFRWDGDLHAINLIPALSVPKPSNPWINLGLFILTIISVLITGVYLTLSFTGVTLPSDPSQAFLFIIKNAGPYTLCMMAILSAHEFGHYFVGRYHGVHLTLPYFIPMPFSPIGTMGAVINMKEVPKNKRVLMDIGIAGPLAGLIVTIPVVFVGLAMSKVYQMPLTHPANSGFIFEGNSILYLLAKYLMFGRLVPGPANYNGMSPFLYWISFFFTGQPIPWGGFDLNTSLVAWAGWAGLLVTGMNLMPAGQLDGGHMIYVLLGRKRASKLLPVVMIGLALLGLVWFGWWIWVALIFFLGRTYAEPLDQITPLGPGRKALAILAMVIFVLTFAPIPLNSF
jgi:membrane-associated protease RseP (regulator of RpoE activity)